MHTGKIGQIKQIQRLGKT